MDLHRPDHPVVTYGTYPLLAAVTAAGLVAGLRAGADPGLVVVGLEALAIAVLALVEWRHPLRPEWSMTGRSFFRRDLPYLGAGMVVVRVAELAGLALVASLGTADGFGPVAALPIGVQAVVGLLAFDLLWYGYHRLAHGNRRLWRVHGVHHAPPQVYVLMHPVFHPLDLVASRLVIAVLALRLTGLSAPAVLVAVVVMNLQQMVSHVNADLRTGPVAYVLIGPETHRFHHSATDRGNYGSVLTVWDHLFGTFVHHPDRVPARLGLDDPATFPPPERFHATLAWAFRPIGAPALAGAPAGEGGGATAASR